MNPMNRFLVRSLLIAAIAPVAATAIAQEFPAKPVTIIVPTAPASVADLLARALSPRLSPRLGQPVVVENRTGAAGNIGIAYVSKAPADGYTVVLCANTLVMAPLLQKSVGYDPVKDFAPIGRLAVTTLAFVVHPSVAATSLKEYVALARAKPKQLNYATPGNGTPHHLAMEHLKQLLGGLEITHVPFAQSSTMMTEMVAGRVEGGFVSLVQTLPFAQSGKLRVLAIAADKRSASLPDTPSFAELGMETLDSPWVGLLAPAGTPPAAVNRLSRELQAVLAAADIQEAMQKAGMVISVNTPAEFAAQIQGDLARWQKVVAAAGIKAD